MKEVNFSENDIRPKNLYEAHKNYLSIDIGRMLSMREKFVWVACPACGGNDARLKYEKYFLEYQECSKCQTLYINPRPTPHVLEWFYKGSVNYDYWNKYIFPASEDARRSRIFVPRVEKVLAFCEKYNLPTDSLLEIGCAFGTFCEEMKSRGRFKRIVGIEPTPGLAQTSRSKGIEVIEDIIENVSFPETERFDVVVNFEVIEHIFSPRDFIVQSKKLLKKGGLFIVTCPNGMGFDFVVLKEKCNSMDHEHLNYFNPDSLSLLLQHCGFEVLEAITPGRLDAELVRNKVLEGSFDISQQPFLKQVLIDKWETAGRPFQDFISNAGLSSNLWMVARNRQ